MKRNYFLLFLIPILFLSCSNEFFLPNPNIYPDNDDSKVAEGSWHAPKDLKSTQGAKRTVKLTWKSVKDAVRYNIYRAENEFSTFSQVGETKGRECEFVVKTEPGFDMYYCVTAVDVAGNESDMSNIERATTLAKPFINSIEGAQDNSDSSVYVSWYMNNADAYEDGVSYSITCFDEKNREIQSHQTKGDVTTVLFTGLSPNTNYLYKVVAYNSNNESEESELIDAATARRLRPDSVTDLVAGQGVSKNSLSLSFVLPNFVDVMVEKNVYEPTPLYFKIYRRVYKDGENVEPFKLIKDDFGVNKVDGVIDYKKVKFGDTAEDYTPGKIVTFIDEAPELKRGEKYEYKVQSFAYIKREISSDESITQTVEPGWLLPESMFETLGLNYIKDSAGAKTNAVLRFNFSMNTYGIPYKYKIVEIKNDIRKESEPVSEDLITKDSIIDINNYSRMFDLKNEEGYFKYKISILTPDGQTELDSYEAVGESLVTANEIPKIGDITITSGYADKIVLEWNQLSVNNYKLKYWDNGVPGEKPLVENKNPSVEGPCVYEDNTAKPGVVRTYQLVVNNGSFDVPSKIMEAAIPMKPELSSNYAYDKISVVVNNGEAANKASYDVTVAFEDDTLNNTYELKPVDSSADAASALTAIDPLTFDYEIVKKSGGAEGAVPSDSIDAAVAGAKVSVSVTEKHPLNIRTYVNEVESNGEAGAVFTEVLPFTDVAGDEQLLSNKITTAYVGPALLHQTASQGTNADNITVTWDKVIGADSYVVFRDRYHLGRSGKKDDLELQNSMSDKYIVTLNEDGTVTVKCDDAELEASELSKYVSAVYSAETGKFTLTDKYRAKTDTDAGNQWRTGQSEITWGAPNQYTVMPVLSVADGDNSSKDKNIVSIDKLKIENVKDVLGGTKGYGWNVTATQGTYASSGSVDSSGNKINDAIEIKWTEPYFGNKEEYAVFRKEAFTEQPWEKKFISNKNVTSYVDNSIEQGKIYDYAIVDVNYGNPLPDFNFIKSQKLGENGSEIKDSLGFILPKPKISKVSRNDMGIGNEEVKFFVNPEINDMIKGYIIQVRNNNIDDKWHDIKTVPITPDNKGLTIFTEMVNNDGGLLKVLRDYKHYYRILAYTEAGNQKVYSKPDETPFTNDMDTDYVKWGCRQISNEEFTRAANLLLSHGVHVIWEDKQSDPNLTLSTRGNGFMQTIGEFSFKSFARTFGSKAGSSVVFLKATGVLNALYYGGNNPYQYNSGDSYINFNCSDSSITDLYSGSIKFNNDGTMNVIYGKNDQGQDITKNYVYNDTSGAYCPLVLGYNGATLGNKRGYLNNNPEWQ